MSVVLLLLTCNIQYVHAQCSRMHATQQARRLSDRHNVGQRVYSVRWKTGQTVTAGAVQTVTLPADMWLSLDPLSVCDLPLSWQAARCI